MGTPQVGMLAKFALILLSVLLLLLLPGCILATVQRCGPEGCIGRVKVPQTITLDPRQIQQATMVLHFLNDDSTICALRDLAKRENSTEFAGHTGASSGCGVEPFIHPLDVSQVSGLSAWCEDIRTFHETKRSYHLLAGETALREEVRGCGNLNYVTILRDPLEHMLSYLLAVTTAAAGKPLEAGNYTEDHLEVRSHHHQQAAMRSPDNFHIRSLLGKRADSIPLGGITKEHEEEAKSILEREFAFVIPMPHVAEESVWPVLERMLGWGGPPDLAHLQTLLQRDIMRRRAERRKALSDFRRFRLSHPRLAAQARRQYRLDHDLYTWAVARFEAQKCSQMANEARVSFENIFKPHIEVGFHNLGRDRTELRIPCVPKVWLLLSGQYRTFRDTRHSVRNMLQRSVGECYFVVIVVPTTTSDKGGQPAVASDLHSNLEEDVTFFDSRLVYFALTRQTSAAANQWFNFAVNYRALWVIAETLQRMHAIHTDASTIIIRSRPDMCFRDCFDFTNAAKVFASHHYLIIGQQISSDCGMFTNWVTYAEQMAPYIGMDDAINIGTPRESVAFRNAWQRASTDVYPNYCKKGEPSNVSCAVKTYEGAWENSCICRDSMRSAATGGEGGGLRCLNGQEGSDQPAAVNLTRDRACVDITAGMRCVYPAEKVWDRLPKEQRPTEEELTNGLESLNFGYMPNGGIMWCKKKLVEPKVGWRAD
eukprot:CAMPEP_0198205154 /NCGR_PEP_ID=MMETSP1445-20131203/8626_1 /TAXON_ID=36898 /ORGANISM="Pyramimonas sp., Strain CCMP2087" /LENGTH=708 /DNA_ID=CAMNT_0043877317 /DNA_START=184 /DNA_END=2310 /DNA_ORIENTATION=-